MKATDFYEIQCCPPSLAPATNPSPTIISRRKSSDSSISKKLAKKKIDPKVKEDEDYPKGEEWRCVNCGVRAHETPLKRRGPDGKRNICNACYVRFRVKLERSERGTSRPILPANISTTPLKSHLSTTPQLSSPAWCNYVYGSAYPNPYQNNTTATASTTAPVYTNPQLVRESGYYPQEYYYYKESGTINEMMVSETQEYGEYYQQQINNNGHYYGGESDGMYDYNNGGGYYTTAADDQYGGYYYDQDQYEYYLYCKANGYYDMDANHNNNNGGGGGGESSGLVGETTFVGGETLESNVGGGQEEMKESCQMEEFISIESTS